MHTQPRVYLAGPITDATRAEAFDWREYVQGRLAPHGIIGVNPLRCEPLRAGATRYTATDPDPKFGTARAIGAKNLFDVMSCEMTLAYMPVMPQDVAAVDELVRTLCPYTDPKLIQAYLEGAQAAHKRVQSYGTLGELFWANALRKMTLLVSDDKRIMGHPTIDCATNWKLSTLDEAIEVIVGVLAVYSSEGDRLAITGDIQRVCGMASLRKPKTKKLVPGKAQ